MQKSFDYIPLIIYIGIKDENIDIIIQFIKKDSNKEKNFINAITSDIKYLNTLCIICKETL